MAGPANPRDAATERFLRRCAALMRGWLWLIGLGIGIALIGIMPSLIVILALLGIVVVPILVLVFWGRLLDDLVTHRRDGEGNWDRDWS